MKVTVLYNLPDTENNSEIAESDDDTQKTALEVSENLRKIGYECNELGIDYASVEKIREIKADIVFNLVEWTGKHIDDGVKVIKVLAEMNVPYTGSDAMGYELSSNKVLMKKMMDEQGITTPKWQAFDKDTFGGVMVEFTYPVIIKPALEHCGIGVTQKSVVQNATELRKLVGEYLVEYKTAIIAEEYVAGRELHVTVLEQYGIPWVLPPAEVVFTKKEGVWPILSYDAKWREKSDEYGLSAMTLAKLEDNLARKIEEMSKRAYEKLGGRDYPRLDIRIRGTEVYVLEINNNPGIDFDLQSGIGVSGRAVGFDYSQLLKHIVNNAYMRFKPA